MSLFKELLYEPFVLIFRNLKLLGFTCYYARVFLVQILLDIFESLIAINQFIRFDQPILAFLVVLQFLRVVVTVFLLLSERIFLFIGYVCPQIVFRAVETCLGFDDFDVLRFKLSCLKLLRCFRHIWGRLENFNGFDRCIFLDQILKLDIQLILYIKVLV